VSKIFPTNFTGEQIKLHFLFIGKQNVHGEIKASTRLYTVGMKIAALYL